MNKARWLLGLSMVLGAVLGLAAPQAARATTINVELRVYGGASNVITCGWQADCSAGNLAGGDALDWDNGDNANVYWRSFAYRSDGTYGTVAYGTTAHTSSGNGCNVIEAQLKDVFGFTKGTAEYHHTSAWVFYREGDPNYPPFAITASGSWAWTQPGAIGFSVTSEPGGCPFSDGASHDHQIQGPQYWWARQGSSGSSCGGYYPDYSCRFWPYYPHSSYLSLEYWQFRQGWTWNLP